MYIIKMIGNPTLYWTGKGWEPTNAKAKEYTETAAEKLLTKIENTPVLQPILPKIMINDKIIMEKVK